MKHQKRHCTKGIFTPSKSTFQGEKTGLNKAGFTLIELLVYMAIVGIVVVIAGQAFSDSTKMRVRTESMIKATSISGSLTTIVREDLSQMGAKSSKEASIDENDHFYTGAIHDIYMDPDNATTDLRDSSSYIITKDNSGVNCYHDQSTTSSECDRLTMRRLRYKADGTYDAVEEISWYVESGSLKRSCKTLKGNEDAAGCPSKDSNVVTISENIEKFIITAANPNIRQNMLHVLPSTSESIKSFRLVSRYDESNFDPIDFDPVNGGESIKIFGFASNYDFETNTPISEPTYIRVNQAFLAESNSDDGTWKSLCKKVTLLPSIEYEISFTMPANGNDPSRMFCPGRDHLSVGFRYADYGNKPSTLNDFAFYPPSEGGAHDIGLRQMRFFVPDTIKDVCLAFTFSSFSPIASSGSLRISNVKLKKVASSSYSFNNTAIAITDKKNVKAMKVQFTVKKNGEAGSSTLFIPTPSNGPRD